MFGLRGFISPVGGLLTDLPALPASLRQLELLPVEAAEFYAVLLDRALALTPAEGGRVRGVLENHFFDRAAAGFAGPRPESIAQTVWDENRAALLTDVVQQVTDAVPVAAAVPQIVEGVLGLADASPTDSIPLADIQQPAALPVDGSLSDGPLAGTRPAVANPPATTPVGNPAPTRPDVAGGLLPGGR
jgi:hypothetical protein